MGRWNNIFSRIKNHRIKLGFFIVLFALYWNWLPDQLFKKSFSTVLNDESGELLGAQIAADGQWRFPPSDSIPVKFRHCLLTFEDEYFYRHPGVNPVSLFKSLKRNIASASIKSGGSTLTMQVARMMRGNPSRTYWNKLVEMLMALRIELSYSKDSILNIYASNAPFGSNVVGLYAASWRYFGRSPENLSWAESALLAVLPNAPSLIYPGKNRERLILKRNRLLKKLLDKKIIDAQTYHLSVSEPVPGAPHPIPQAAPHLIARAAKEYGAGKCFRTTLQKDLQLKVTALLNDHIQKLSANQIHNGCVLVCDNNTGNVLAYAGNSYSKNNEHENYVDVIEAPRSTGSILKPFLYAFMLEEGKLLPSSLIEDVPLQIGSYGPKNFNLTHDGLVAADKAIARSLNVPAVKLLIEYGAAKFHHRLKQLGFRTFTRPTDHYGLSLILGGGEATLWDVASAYASMARSLSSYSNTRNKYASGNYHALNYLKTFRYPRQLNSQSSDLLSASTVWFTFKAMTELLRPEDYVGWMQFLSRNRIAWKTGTSFGFRDAWAVGLNGKYTVAVWVGNASGEGRPELTGTSAAAPLMFAVFNSLSDKTWFAKPASDMVQLKVCRQSGYRASAICPNAELRNCQKGGERAAQCKFHRLVHLDESGTYRVNSNCYPVSRMKHLAWFVASPVQEYFLRQHSLSYMPLPPYLNGCEPESGNHQLEIVYPRNDYKIYVPIDESGKKSRCIFKAAHKNQDATLYWYLDGHYAGETSKYHQLSLLPESGKHELSITDNFGESCLVRFELIAR